MGEPTRVLVMGTGGIKNDGITSWMRGVYGAMNREGFELTTMAFDGAGQAVIDSVMTAGIHVMHMPDRQRRPLQYMGAFRALLGRKRFDVIHMCGSSALCEFEIREAKRHGVGMRIVHSHNTTCTHPTADRLLRPALYRDATDFYACGRDAGRWLFGDRPFTVIPNGKELDDWAFSPEVRGEVRVELGLESGHIAIGHVGRFNTQKNHAKLLHAFAELHRRSGRYRLVLVGDGGLVEETKALAQSLGIADSVLFLGRRDDVPRLLNAMDCMVLPSLYEGFPNVVLEWQLSGLPVVMSDTVTDDVAITPLVTQVPLTADDVVWADTIARALSDRNRATDSANARKTAKEQGYDIHDDAALLRRLYLEGVAR